MTTTDPGRTAEPMTQDEAIASIGNYGYGWHDSDAAGAAAPDDVAARTAQLWPHRHGTDAMFLALLQRPLATDAPKEG